MYFNINLCYQKFLYPKYNLNNLKIDDLYCLVELHSLQFIAMPRSLDRCYYFTNSSF